MTRINTNVSSLIAQTTLARNTTDLQQALTRLSTGLRINVGKDDPAGLIASEALRSDITSIERAISNSERANQVIATADSSLGQVSKLLNDIRGLVVEAANTGAMSEDQLSANQLQVDSSLEAINRIAQTTTFQGRRLLDGSLEFISTVGSVSTVVDSQIDQANLGTVGAVSVDVDIAAAAAQAEITSSGFSAAQQATATINFAAGANIDSAANSFTIDIDAAGLGDAEVGVAISMVDSNGATGVTVAYTAGTSLTVTADFTNNTISGDDIISALNAQQSAFVASGGAGTTSGQFTAADVLAFNAASVATDRDSIDLQAVTAGADFNQVAISVEAGAGNGATFDAVQNTLTVTLASGAQTVADVTAAINTDLAGVFTATGNADGSTRVNAATVDADATANTDNTGGNVLLDDLVVSIGGETGREVFNFEAGASVNQILAAVNLVSDATGVAASQESGALVLNSTAYGSDAFVDVDVLDEGVAGTFESGLTDSPHRGNGYPGDGQWRQCRRRRQRASHQYRHVGSETDRIRRRRDELHVRDHRWWCPVPIGPRCGQQPTGSSRHPEYQRCQVGWSQRPVVRTGFRWIQVVAHRSQRCLPCGRRSDRQGYDLAWSIGCVPTNHVGYERRFIDRHVDQPDRGRKCHPRCGLRQGIIGSDASSDSGAIRYVGLVDCQQQSAKCSLATAITDCGRIRRFTNRLRLFAWAGCFSCWGVPSVLGQEREIVFLWQESREE